MTTKEKIAVMQAWLNGKSIQVKSIASDEVWYDVENEPSWDWLTREYRIKPEKTSIPATEEELRQVKTKWYKTKDSGILFCNAHESSCLSYPEDISPDDYFLLNPDTGCWEDWSEE